jgi:TRAP-type C4-dicarboxylate transport system permease small subunit
LESLNRVSRLLANAVGVLGALGILVMMLHITVDVLARLFLGSPLIGTNEVVSRYYMVAAAFLPLAWVEHRKGMIAVEIFDSLLGRKTLLIGDLLVAVVSVGVLLLLGWTSLGEAVEAFGKSAFVMAVGTRIPVWPTYFMIPAGCFLAAVMVLLRAAVLVLSGRPLAPIEKDAR